MLQNQFTRTEILLGTESVANLMGKHVFIAGLGGVGGHVVEAVVRAGVGKVTIVDHDVVDITNINRQIIATLDNVSQFKALEFEKRIKQINPQINLVTIKQFIEADNLQQLLADKPDYVVDCIDTVNSKLSLLIYCLRNKIKVVSSMGAGNRIDVTRAKFADISQTKVCALARNIRLKLREHGIKKGLPVVYSEETPFNQPIPNPAGGRPINGTISYLPALFGIMLAGKVIKELIVNE